MLGTPRCTLCAVCLPVVRYDRFPITVLTNVHSQSQSQSYNSEHTTFNFKLCKSHGPHANMLVFWCGWGGRQFEDARCYPALGAVQGAWSFNIPTTLLVLALVLTLLARFAVATAATSLTGCLCVLQ